MARELDPDPNSDYGSGFRLFIIFKLQKIVDQLKDMTFNWRYFSFKPAFCKDLAVVMVSVSFQTRLGKKPGSGSVSRF